MARRRMKIGLVAVLVVAAATLWAGAAAQSSLDCTNVLISMSLCLNYISGNSSTPSSNCCSQLASVIRSQPQCLCQDSVIFKQLHIVNVVWPVLNEPFPLRPELGD
ncbi:hypothetical protein CDL15_Pgr002590 [Punica granatum]|uniref:Bifunctional inhibitor/plant lipid transfer protein/seed storage helical domain-containing protein n=1 Tax=Punica granatum TaxID=22663 RepID=A0A218WWX4_PUNGR|nr:hypothetical protein CDL15_Pgr002590 [Punica granatum]